MTDKKKGGAGKYIAFGCLSVVLLAVVGGYFAYRGVMGYISEMTDTFTSSEPLKLQRVTITEQEVADVMKRVSTFADTLKQNGRPAPLVLTAKDINALIQQHPDWSDINGKVYININNDKVIGQTSLPLDKFGGMFKGRYLNGTAEFRVGMASGRLLVFIEAINVGEKSLPEEIISELQSKNFAEGVNEEPNCKKILQKLDSIDVRGGSLYITPKML